MARSFIERARFKENLMGIIGIALIILVAIAVFFWVNGGEEKLYYKDVIVLKSDTPAHTVITEDMITTKKIEKSALIENVIVSSDQIVGKESVTFLPMNLQLSTMFFLDPGMVVGDGMYVFPLPQEWLYAMPQTLRRGDTVYFYPVAGEEAEAGTKVSTYVTSAKVAFVKDSSNKEVVDMSEERLDASGTATRIEIVIDDSIYKILKNGFDNGEKYIVTYQ